jgi:tetratricopeptide (TPR) repeat protein
MLATGNFLRNIAMILSAALCATWVGCSPSGPRALISGDELLRKGKPAQAVVKLKRATELLPDEPRAWNLLGIAYHRAGQLPLAAQAYQRALAKDRSNVVAVAHYNLGCLLLEQNNPAAAAEQFRSFTLTTNSAAGLIKLGTAQMRLRRLDLAETAFEAARRLEPKNPEVLNGIGLIHAQRSQRDALQYFNAALQADTKYAPALLNSAILAQQNAATRPLALQRFRDYVAVAPNSAQAPAAKLFVRSLEAELSPPPSSNSVASLTLKTNALVAAAQTTNTNRVTNAASLTASTNLRTPVTLAKTNAPALPAKTNQLLLATNPPPLTTNVPLTVVTVTSTPAPRIAAATLPIATSTPPVNTSRTVSSETTPIQDATEEPKKPGFFTRLNPFRGKTTAATTSEVPSVVVLTPQTNLAASSAKPVFPRYTYTSPGVPRSGNRAEAERAMSKAIRAQRAGNTNEALLDYSLATSADPAYFDAQYNAALLALQAGDLRRALLGFELALALQPESINARYTFALALKQANYAYDAVSELQKILQAKPNEARAHLTLANLFAQQFGDKDKAREHYRKVIELEPRNSQAAAIRFWLAANP